VVGFPVNKYLKDLNNYEYQIFEYAIFKIIKEAHNTRNNFHQIVNKKAGTWVTLCCTLGV